jgi:hypothetical protein
MSQKAFIYIAIFSTTLFACSKSKTQPQPVSPSISSVSQGLTVKRITHTFSASENHEHNNFVFSYSGNKLTSGSSQIFYTTSNQKLSDPIANFTLIQTATIVSGTYASDSFSGTINSIGYLATLVFPGYTVTFTYTSDGYLKKVTETYSSGQIVSEFTYSGGNLVTLQEAITDNNITNNATATFQYGSGVNKSGVWPPPFEVGSTGYLSMFYYAALLGKPTKNLPVSFNYQSSYANINETYSFTYTDGYVATCRRNSSAQVNGTTLTSSDLVTYAYN